MLQNDDLKDIQDRFIFLYVILAIFPLLLVGRLWFLQIYNGQKFRGFSEKNRLRTERVEALRGVIYDRDGRVLADNKISFDLTWTPQFIKNKKETLALLKQLTGLPSEDAEKILRKQAGPQFHPIVIKKDLNRDEVATISSHGNYLPGIDIEIRPKRVYLHGSLLSHLLGYIREVTRQELVDKNKLLAQSYVSGDMIGKSGIEKSYEGFLRGQPGITYVEVDAQGKRRNQVSDDLKLAAFKSDEAQPGLNLILSLDYDLQKAAADAFGNEKGAIVAVDLRSGEVLAMLSLPGFDPSELSENLSPEKWRDYINNPFHPLRNKVIQDHYQPGSTFKLVTAVAALEEGAINPDTISNCNGQYQLGNRIYHCHKKGGHGNVNLQTAISRSCNIFFYKIALKLGINTIAKYAHMLGLGQLTNISLQHETTGLIPSSFWLSERKLFQQWSLGETLNIAIGQGYDLVTPLQLALAYGAVGNGGKLVKPVLVQNIMDEHGRVIKTFNQSNYTKLGISDYTINEVKKGLLGVVQLPSGTAFWRRPPGLRMAGKTGTSQVFKRSAKEIYSDCMLLPYELRHHGWFVGFAPEEKPEIAIAAIAEHTCHGNSGAMPIVNAVMNKYFEKKYGPMTKEKIQFEKDYVNKRLNKDAIVSAIEPSIPHPSKKEEDIEEGVEERLL